MARLGPVGPHMGCGWFRRGPGRDGSGRDTTGEGRSGFDGTAIARQHLWMWRANLLKHQTQVSPETPVWHHCLSSPQCSVYFFGRITGCNTQGGATHVHQRAADQHGLFHAVCPSCFCAAAALLRRPQGVVPLRARRWIGGAAPNHAFCPNRSTAPRRAAPFPLMRMRPRAEWYTGRGRFSTRATPPPLPPPGPSGGSGMGPVRAAVHSGTACPVPRMCPRARGCTRARDIQPLPNGSPQEWAPLRCAGTWAFAFVVRRGRPRAPGVGVIVLSLNVPTFVSEVTPRPAHISSMDFR